MAESLYDLLKHQTSDLDKAQTESSSQDATKYLSRLLSLRLSDLTTTEPQSLSQSAHSNLVSVQALSSRSYRTTTASSDHLSTLNGSLPVVSSSVGKIRDAVPQLDESAVAFASTYSKSKDDNKALIARKESMLLSRQADKLQDILELPSLLSTAIASAGTGSAGGANYSQALDLFAHIKRLQVLYPDSNLVKSTLQEAELAMKDMTTNLISSLRGQNIRLAAAIRTIGWLRRVAPELSRFATHKASTSLSAVPITASAQDEGDFGALFLCARLCTFLTMTEALAPLQDLADQETARRLQSPESNGSRPEFVRRSSSTGAHAIQGQQTERYLKRYIEIFREQSFACISMFRNIFPQDSSPSTAADLTQNTHNSPGQPEEDALSIPSALATFPLRLVEILMETLEKYLPNVVDPAARESLLMQVLYAANSLGRLGADFSMMIALLDNDGGSSTKRTNPQMADVAEETEEGEVDDERREEEQAEGEGEGKSKQEEESEPKPEPEPEWARVIKKHRVQAARLEAMAAGQDQMAGRRASGDIAVR